jgi:hypothetical protein
MKPLPATIFALLLPSVAFAQSAPAVVSDDELRDVVLHALRDPKERAIHAPRVTSVADLGKGKRSRIRDLAQTQRWLLEIPYVSRQAAKNDDGDASTWSCDGAKLRCTVFQPGGETVLVFRVSTRNGEKLVQWTEVWWEEP